MCALYYNMLSCMHYLLYIAFVHSGKILQMDEAPSLFTAVLLKYANRSLQFHFKPLWILLKLQNFSTTNKRLLMAYTYTNTCYKRMHMPNTYVNLHHKPWTDFSPGYIVTETTYL